MSEGLSAKPVPDQRFAGNHVIWMAIREGRMDGYQEHILNSVQRPIEGRIEGWKGSRILWTAQGMFSHGSDLVDEGYDTSHDS